MKYLGINLLKEVKDLYPENYKTDERNKRLHKQMKRYTMFLDWKNQYCENDYTTQSNLPCTVQPSCTVGGMEIDTAIMENSMELLLKTKNRITI